MSFPTMTSTWKFSSVGLTNVIPLPKGGGPYTVGLDKASGAYTGQLYWSPNLDASPLDDSWKTLTDLNTTDETGLVVGGVSGNDDVRAIMGSITVRPTPALSGGIYTPIAKFEISVVPTNSRGANQRQRHGSGYGSNLIDGVAPVQDEYAALVLADMGVSVGSFFAMQDGNIGTLTDSGPDNITDMTDQGTGATEGDGPWEGSKAIHFNRPSTAEIQSNTFDLNWAVSEEGSLEAWFRNDQAGDAGANTLMDCGINVGIEVDPGPADDFLQINIASTVDEPDNGAWLASTAYSLGDRVRAVADDNRVKECTVAGTSGACEPVWPTDGTTVADNTVTWQDMGSEARFHDLSLGVGATANGQLDQLQTAVGAISTQGDTWYHMVVVRRSTSWDLYINGVLTDQQVLASLPGVNGTPPRMGFADKSYTNGQWTLGSQNGGSAAFDGAITYVAHYRAALSAAQILSHYDKGVELGL